MVAKDRCVGEHGQIVTQEFLWHVTRIMGCVLRNSSEPIVVDDLCTPLRRGCSTAR
jgi:hypothetical protein